ncbi:hypothetical protein K1719_013429 [Acacia pycnantha]|nr:hypothetical protein K1719_013429 [Acacia pycnantha]
MHHAGLVFFCLRWNLIHSCKDWPKTYGLEVSGSSGMQLVYTALRHDSVCCALPTIGMYALFVILATLPYNIPLRALLVQLIRFN